MDINTLNKIETNPFEDNDFKSYWCNIYKETGNKDFIQRLYNIDKITKEDYITIVGEEPLEKYQPNNIFIKFRKDMLNQDRIMLALDLKLLLLEVDIPEVRVNTLNTDYYTFLNRIIDSKNYNTSQEIESIIEIYHEKNKISNEQKTELIEKIANK